MRYEERKCVQLLLLSKGCEVKPCLLKSRCLDKIWSPKVFLTLTEVIIKASWSLSAMILGWPLAHFGVGSALFPAKLCNNYCGLTASKGIDLPSSTGLIVVITV